MFQFIKALKFGYRLEKLTKHNIQDRLGPEHGRVGLKRDGDLLRRIKDLEQLKSHLSKAGLAKSKYLFNKDLRDC